MAMEAMEGMVAMEAMVSDLPAMDMGHLPMDTSLMVISHMAILPTGRVMAA